MARKIIGEKKLEFEKSDRWDNCIFYRIFEMENEKYIQIDFETKRQDWGKGYDDWTCLDLRYKDVSMKLKDFLEWDKFYNLEKITQPYKNEWKAFVDPKTAFEFINNFVMLLDLGVHSTDEDGRRELWFTDLSLETPCGRYYYY